MSFYKELEIHLAGPSRVHHYHEELDDEIVLVLACAVIGVDRERFVDALDWSEEQREHRDDFIASLAALLLCVRAVGLNPGPGGVNAEDTYRDQRREVPRRRCFAC